MRQARRAPSPLLGRYGLQGAIACAIFFAFYLAQVIVPALSTHLSFKPVLESYAKFAKHGEKIGRYRVEGHGSTFYSKENLVDLPNQDRVVSFLRDPQRVFALVAAAELAPLDSAFKQAQVAYYVVDASSSRFLLLTNQLDPGESDQNPLLKDVWMPPAGAAADAPSPPGPGASRSRATFDDAIELVGADFPTEVRRPGKIPLDLYFRVKAKPPGGYKIFVHFDGPAAPRVIGDHDPVNHAFGTGFWLPGEYVRDHYETDVPLMTTPAGTYVVYMGFWPGGEGKRLKITAGPNDGQDRVRIGDAGNQVDCASRMTRRGKDRRRREVTVSSDRRRSGRDRRVHARVTVDIEVDYKSADNFLFAYITDISAMGIFIRTNAPEPPGTKLNLSFARRGGPRLNLEGRVMWVNPFRPGSYDNINPGMGVQFVDLSAEQREQIVNLVRTFAYLSDDEEPKGNS